MAHRVRGVPVSLRGPALLSDSPTRPTGEDSRSFPTVPGPDFSIIDTIEQVVDIGGKIGLFGGRRPGTPTPLVDPGPCTPPFVRDQSGICVLQGSPADISTGPSGFNGTGVSGVAVMGAFGIPAMQPVVVGNIGGSPIRRCMAGAVLGKDDLCYMKGSIPRQFRKWRPAAKPPMSAADAKALRRIGTLQNKVKGLAKSANLTCKKR